MTGLPVDPFLVLCLPRRSGRGEKEEKKSPDGRKSPYPDCVHQQEKGGKRKKKMASGPLLTSVKAPSPQVKEMVGKELKIAVVSLKGGERGGEKEEKKG